LFIRDNFSFQSPYGRIFELLSCGCCVDIQHYEVYNILGHATRLDETDITFLLSCEIVYNASQYVSSFTFIGRKF